MILKNFATIAVLNVGLAGSMAGAAISAAANPDDPEHPTRASLVAEHTALVPGATARIGILFEIDREWHLYWDGQNDSGFPPEIDLKLPHGFSAGKILWPAPKRKIYPGEILDHIYEHELLLMIPIEVPADARPGENIMLAAHVEWLVCKEACIPGWGDYTLTIEVAEPGAEPMPSRYAPIFDRTTRRLPRPLPESGGPIATVREGETFAIAAPDAVRMAFYPGNGCARLTDLIKSGEAKESSLSLRLARPEESDRIRGIVEIWTAPATSTVWWIDTAPGAAAERTAAPTVSD